MNIFTRKQLGVSLIELMIALALGSVVTTGIISLFVSNSKTYNLLTGQSRMQESARFALEFIGRSVRIAGYRGCFSSSNVYTLMNPPPPDPLIPYEFDLRNGVEAFEATGVDVWSPVLTPLPTTIGVIDTNVWTTTDGTGAGNGIDTSEITSGTDVLTLRGLSQVDARVAVNMPTSGEPVVVQMPAGGLEYADDYLVMIHDCAQGTIFRISGAPQLNTPAAGQATIGHGMADADRGQNTLPNLAQGGTYSTDASVTAILTHIFFIAPGAGLNNLGSTPLSLWRKSGLQAPVELVEGVEHLQILFGVDTDSDGVPNQYRTANMVAADFTQVVTVRVSVTVNSVDNVESTSLPTHGCVVQDCIEGEAYDGLLRRTFTQTIMLRNSA